MEIQNVKKLIVKYNEKTVGYLAELEENRIGFQNDEEWVKIRFSIHYFLYLFQIKNKYKIYNQKLYLLNKYKLE